MNKPKEVDVQLLRDEVRATGNYSLGDRVMADVPARGKLRVRLLGRDNKSSTVNSVGVAKYYPTKLENCSSVIITMLIMLTFVVEVTSANIIGTTAQVTTRAAQPAAKQLNREAYDARYADMWGEMLHSYKDSSNYVNGVVNRQDVGRTAYAAAAWRNNRWIISIVMVMDLDLATQHALYGAKEVTQAVANNMRVTLGNAKGWWASTAWGYFGTNDQGAGTIVVRLLMPKWFTIESEGLAVQAAQTIASAWRISTDVIRWFYPKNGNMRRTLSDGVLMMGQYEYSDGLAVHLRNIAFGIDDNITRSRVFDVDEGVMASNRSIPRAECRDPNIRDSIIWNWYPVSTTTDYGCVGRQECVGYYTSCPYAD